MDAPTKLARNHALVLVIGGDYRGSVLDASVIWNSDDYTTTSRERLISITTIDSKNSHWRKGWTWCKKDIKWVTRATMEGRQFEDGVEDNVSAKVRKAIKKYDGAWVIRFKVGR